MSAKFRFLPHKNNEVEIAVRQTKLTSAKVIYAHKNIKGEIKTFIDLKNDQPTIIVGIMVKHLKTRSNNF